MPDPLSHAADMTLSPNLVIRELTYQVAYARERVLQGDWTEKYARQRIDLCYGIAADKLSLDLGCTSVSLYANLTTGCRAVLVWDFTDRNGVRSTGNCHPTMEVLS